MRTKDKLLIYIDKKKISRSEFYKKTGLSNGFLDKEGGVTTSNLEKILSYYDDLSPEWLLTGRGEMLRFAPINENKNIQANNSNVVLGDHSNVDVRQYYSDSPDVLRAQIDERDRLLEEKECRIKEKDAQIKEKDAQINKLLGILEK